jgi:hypothetical protein
MGPSPVWMGGWSMMCRSIGSTKASVLPEPCNRKGNQHSVVCLCCRGGSTVLAQPMQSRPLMMTGMACAWIGKGAL